MTEWQSHDYFFHAKKESKMNLEKKTFFGHQTIYASHFRLNRNIHHHHRAAANFLFSYSHSVGPFFICDHQTHCARAQIIINIHISHPLIKSCRCARFIASFSLSFRLFRAFACTALCLHPLTWRNRATHTHTPKENKIFIKQQR